jgi:hypothetical protein
MEVKLGLRTELLVKFSQVYRILYKASREECLRIDFSREYLYLREN